MIEPSKDVTLSIETLAKDISSFEVASFRCVEIRDPKNRVALVMCSSGTTGLPKGVMLTHKNMITTIEIFKYVFVFLS